MDARPPARSDVLRDQLVDLFLAEGFAGLHLGDLARRMRCSKSTLYAVAPSKEQLITAVVRAFFRRSTARVEAAVDADDPVRRIDQYLTAISVELAPASPAFFADLDAFGPAREIYRQNTRRAAERVRALVLEADPRADAAFVGAVAGLVMEAIHRGDVEQDTGLDDSAALRALARLIVAGLAPR